MIKSKSFRAKPERTARHRIVFAVIAIVVTLLLFGFGGSSRVDAGALLVLRPLLVLAVTAAMMIGGTSSAPQLRPLWLLLAMFAATMLVQLIPLPPELWLSLPGHAPYRQAAEVIGQPQPWRPISLTPELTLNSLVALIVPAAILIMYGKADARLREHSLLIPIGIALVSALYGIVQVSVASDALYFYRPTSEGLPVGMFANRNHQAVVLAAALPPLAAWVLHGSAGRALAMRSVGARIALAGLIALLLTVVILVTGSRAGVIAAGIGFVTAALWLLTSSKVVQTPKRKLLWGLALLAVPVAGISFTLIADRSSSIDRALDPGTTAELRLRAAPTTWRMTRDFFPEGAGFGAFDQVFRQYEPESLLKPTYFNRAHNDVLETILSGGLLAALVLLLFTGWWLVRAYDLFLGKSRGRTAAIAQVGAVIVVIFTVASFFDYPLRTPLGAAIFALACCWMTERGGRDAALQSASTAAAT